MDCVAFCAKDIRAFEEVAGGGFQQLAQRLIKVGATYGLLDASKVLPHPTTISRTTGIVAEERRQKLVQEIRDVSSSINIGMTTDMWTDDYKKTSYLTITCHYVTPDFVLKSHVLTTAKFPDDEVKSGANIRREIVRELTSIGFDPSIMSKVVWVTDQGSNMISALRGYNRLDCMDHVYNTVMRHALDVNQLGDVVPEVSDTLRAVKEVVRFLKSSGMASRLSHTVKQMVDTRFSTQFLTLRSIKAVYPELQQMLEERDELHRLDGINEDIVDFMVDFLQDFCEAQTELEGDLYPTLNLVALWYKGLLNHCQPDPMDLPYQVGTGYFSPKMYSYFSDLTVPYRPSA